MKTCKHHNNKGLRQIERDKTFNQIKRTCKKLKLPFSPKNIESHSDF